MIVTVRIVTKGRGTNDPDALTPLEMKLLEETRKRETKSWTRYELYAEMYWSRSTAYEIARSLVSKGFLKTNGENYTLTEKADLVRNYRALSSEISYSQEDRRIRTINLNNKSVAEYRTTDGGSGVVPYGTPAWFPSHSAPTFRKITGTPVLNLTLHENPNPKPTHHYS